VHPGRVRSNIMRQAPAPFRLLTRLLSAPPERAGAAIAQLATSPRFAGATGRVYRDGKHITPSASATDLQIRVDAREGLARRRVTPRIGAPPLC
jgi:hypothetical protein